MKFIGITGGVGCGKSTVLAILRELLEDKCIIVEADRVAAALMTKEGACFQAVTGLDWPTSIISKETGEIDRPLMAKFMYESDELRERVNAIVHPAVKDEILHQVADAKEKHNIEYFFFEAALLIECGYDTLTDELWYVYADEAVRRERLSLSRGYSQEKISSIMASQLTEEIFREKCGVIIDNSGDAADTKEQIKGCLWHKKI